MPGGPADPSQVTWRQVTGPAVYYRQHKLTIAALSAAALVRLWHAVQDGSLDDDQMAAAGATTIAAANSQAATLADLFLAHVLETSPLGLTVPADPGRLTAAVLTAASPQGTNPEDALTRLGRSEPLNTAQTSLQDGMKRRDVPGWTRGTSGAPCQVCADLANGTVLPASTDMWSHPGCSCVQEIVTS